MLDAGRKLFAKIHKQKRHANPNHDVHFMAREMDDWLVQGVESMVDGSYTQRHLKRHYFTDEMVDQLHLSDRIFQNILAQTIKANVPLCDESQLLSSPWSEWGETCHAANSARTPGAKSKISNPRGYQIVLQINPAPSVASKMALIFLALIFENIRTENY